MHVYLKSLIAFAMFAPVAVTQASPVTTGKIHSRYPKAKADYEAIVVGSGYGGAVAALNLGNWGVDTLVLERGRWWKVEDPATDATFATVESIVEQADSRGTWLDTRCGGNFYLTLIPPIPCAVDTGILEVIDSEPNAYDHSPKVIAEGINVMVGAGVGGGSLVNNVITYRPTKEGWDLSFPPAELPYMQRIWKSLETRYFERAESRLDASPVPQDILMTDAYTSSQAMWSFGAAMGYPDENPEVPETQTFGRAFAPLMVDWEAVREEIAGARTPAFILGEVWFGNNSGAKKSLDKDDAYLGKAIATGNVDLRALHTVQSVQYDEQADLYTVTAVHTDEEYNTLQEVSFTTRNLIMAAGSVGTTKILVRARERGDLPKLNRHVGTMWNNNGNTSQLRFAADGLIGQGGPAGVKLTDFREPGNPVVLENLSQRVPSVFAQDPQLSSFFGAMLTIGIGIPQGTGNFDYDAKNDTVALHWPADASENVYNRVTELYSDPQMPGTPYILPLESSQKTAVHPLGGVPFGKATDLNCGLKGYRGLYAVDGSIMPGASAVANPTLTITAMAERCMDYIAPSIRYGRR
ncbi:GMC family oxidoreductase [Ketobacter sp. MCCC 1A13808]|uniref:GMC oxidoreductase n=1 Tax=Ketobacter sp. MCCC 1A13808 TaxID=2602738 RepID=UPI000F0D6BFB|nr:GMC oxidoreductase [Ketobacter sp. MCCC 1A13808]MVF13404.1 GMC family oxidoreductase [Ketobacter sp. MCCC 1A13808]RLP55795.1 MAG: GMC family oxidoreductase [Ketobacter sp.]